MLHPLTTEKGRGKKAPSLDAVNCNIFDCCASDIKEDFEDWDPKMTKTATKKQSLLDVSSIFQLNQDENSMI